MKIGNKEFSTGTHVMAIVNATDDSFFEPSRVKDDLFERVWQMVSDGAEVIDVGGQSTRPNATFISPEDELKRVLPVAKAIKKSFDVPVSVDTFFASVAEECLKCGADMVNDISGLTFDKKMAATIAKYDAAVCIMHNRRGSKKGSNLMQDKLDGLQKAVDKARVAGIKKDKILLDGGIGFNFSADEDWELMFNYSALKALGYPLLLGTSRKSFFGGEVENRLNATVNTSAFAAGKNVLFVRVHDVAPNKAAIDAVENAKNNSALRAAKEMQKIVANLASESHKE